MVERVMNKNPFGIILLFLLFCISGFAQVRNGGFGSRGPTPGPWFTQDNVDNYRKAGWKCPDVSEWPQWWMVYGSNGTVEFPGSGGVEGGYAKIGGQGVYLTGYYGLPLEDRNYIYTVWARGNGRMQMLVISYGKNEEGKTVQITKPGEAIGSISVNVNSEKWIRYRHLLVRTPSVLSVHPWVGLENGTLDIDEVNILSSTPALDLIVNAEENLYGTGALIEDKDFVKTDEVFAERQKSYREALAAFEQAKGNLEKVLAESLETEIKALAPTVLTEGMSVVQVPYYNEMIVLTQVLNAVAGGKVEKPPAITATEAVTEKKEFYLLGCREPAAGKVTITDIRSNKVRYDENENATTVAKIANMTDTEQKGTLVALMHLDIDTVREITRTSFTIPAGQTKEWRFSYSVGPETYGRGIEVQFVDGSGSIVDRWQEYYGVAAEWFRIQQHNYNGQMKSYTVDPWTTYYNQRHYFANEPTDWGVQTDWCKNLEQYYSGQTRYHINMAARLAEMAWFRERGVMGTFYQTFAYCGQMGYEVIRQNPEFALYDPNGQFAVDPVYGGYPNPFELASPMEIGPKRKVTKPYLDRKLTYWQHGVANYAMEDAIVFMTEAIKKQAEFLHCDGIYIDGNLGVWRGYGYDGEPNVPSGKYEDFVALNARNHRLFSEMLKKDNPLFGTWYNWTKGAVEYYVKKSGLTFYMGSGGDAEVDPSDDSLRAATGWKNVMLLDETVSQFREGEGDEHYPGRHLEHLCKNRDDMVQGYGANIIIGYTGNFTVSQDAPGLDRWGWSTHNYFGAQLIATQHHFVSWFVPSLRPTIQFMTRYSRLIWAPDIKVVQDAEKIVAVKSPEEAWWKRLVYRRDTGDGYDLIIHLVRIPPYGKWDLKWVDEPKPLTGVSITADTGTGKVQSVYAFRPYYFEEEQQAVEKKLAPTVAGGKVTVEIPPFRYHTMVVLRVKK